MSITELSIKRPSLVIVIFTVLAVLGVFSYFQLKYELIPNVAPPYVTITTIYPGASPKEVEDSVTKKIEDTVSNVDKIKHLSSYSSEGVSTVFIEFNQDANEDVVVQDVQRHVNEILIDFPKEAKTPMISKFSISELPILRMGVTAKMGNREFYQFAKDTIKPRLTKIKGVGQLALIGGEEREIKVNLNLDKLNSNNISILQVLQVIKSSNLDIPAGKIKDADGQYIVRIAGKFSSLDDIRNLVIAKSENSGFVKLKDVAEVEDGIKETSTISRINGKNALGILLQKQSGSNAVEVSSLVREELKKIEKDYKSKKVAFDIAQDSSVFTLESAKAVRDDLLLAILFVGLVMLVFLHSIRNSIIIMIAIPCSLITAFIGMYVLGFTLNLMTLLALSLIIGILVDDSIVVLENIYRHLEKGQDRKKAALEGRNEIGFSALSITLVDVVVFLPLSLIQGMVGRIVRQYSLVIVITTLVSLFVSFTITPMLASRFSKIEKLKNTASMLGKFGFIFEAFFKKIVNLYIRILDWSLRNKLKVIILTSVLFLGSLSLLLFGFIGSEFVTQIDKGEISVQVEMPERVTLDETNFISQKIEKILFQMPEVEKVFVNVGASSDNWTGQTSNNISELNVTLVPRNRRKKTIDEVGKEIKAKASEIPDAKVRVSPIGMFGTGESFPMGIALYGDNYDEVLDSARKVENIMKKTKGIGEVKLTTSEGKPEIKIDIDREKMSDYALTLENVGSSLRIALTGDDDSKYTDGSSEYSIRILLDQFDRSRTSELGRIKFINLKGQQIELRQFAKIYLNIGPNKLRREDRVTSIMVLCQPDGRASGDIGSDLKKSISQEKFPESVTFRDYGDTENQAESFGNLGLALLVAILFVYLIMAALYNSFIYPFVVIFSIPLAIVGALLALALTMKTLNIFSILGIIMLVGLVGKNAILLVDRANKNREKGMNVIESLKEAGMVRIRPILMTSFTMIAGMMPIALAFDGGAAEIKSSLGIVLVGGLTSSMFLTLLFVPVIYMIIDNMKTKLYLKKNIKKRSAAL